MARWHLTCGTQNVVDDRDPYCMECNCYVQLPNISDVNPYGPGGKNYLPPEMVPALASGRPHQGHESDCPDPSESVTECHITCPEELPADVRELLTILAEECSEVVQRCTKILRFGLRVNPWTGKHNRETLERELGDVFAIAALLSKRGVISEDAVDRYGLEKIEAFKKSDGRLRSAQVPEGL